MWILLSLLSLSPAAASPIPCRFSIPVSPKAAVPAYDLGAAYSASSLVAVVKAVRGSGKRNGPDFDGQRAKIVSLVKGKAKGEIELAGVHGAGTDFNGISIPEDGEYLVLLSGGPKYGYADPGSGCPNSFDVIHGKAKIGDRDVPVGKLKKFFASKPAPLKLE